VNEVAAALVRAMIALGTGAGLDPEPLVEGLSFDERSLPKLKRVRWDEYCVLVERTAAALGGPEQLAEVTAKSYAAALPSEVRIVFRTLVSPKVLYRFMFTVLNPAAFPAMTFEYRDISDNQIFIAAKFRDYVRGCRDFNHCSVGAIQGAPLHLGLPRAEVEVEELTDRTLRVRVTPPESQTLLARVRRTSAADLRDASLRLITLFADDARVRADSIASRTITPQRPVSDEIAERVRLVEAKLGLTRRQAEVLAHVVRGLSNKEIGALLKCAENTVELHLTQLLKKCGVQGRVQLVARFWTDELGA
jgi:DNA-binding CsgD family transcriptional regulator